MLKHVGVGRRPSVLQHTFCLSLGFAIPGDWQSQAIGNNNLSPTKNQATQELQGLEKQSCPDYTVFMDMDDELRPEYDLVTLLKDGERGKYAERYKAGTNLVLLDPDVAHAFPTAEAV